MEKSFEEKLAEARAQVPAISPLEASQRRLADPDVLFIDPRDVQDIQATTGMIPGALNISLNQLNPDYDAATLPKELADRTKTIITACQAGPMGALAAHALHKLGYLDVQYIEGGTQGWLDAGFTTH